jgi:hypothetical protein
MVAIIVLNRDYLAHFLKTSGKTTYTAINGRKLKLVAAMASVRHAVFLPQEHALSIFERFFAVAVNIPLTFLASLPAV